MILGCFLSQVSTCSAVFSAKILAEPEGICKDLAFFMMSAMSAVREKV